MLLFCSIATIRLIVAIRSAFPQFGYATMIIPKRIIIKSRVHLEWVARNNVCIITRSNYGVQACHIRNVFGRGDCGLGTKGGDMFVVPMTWQVHHNQHTMSELEFYCKHNINPIEISKSLALKTICKKINNLAKEGFYDYYIEQYANHQASAKSTLESKNI